jgi:hypothetical protein
MYASFDTDAGAGIERRDGYSECSWRFIASFSRVDGLLGLLQAAA